MYVCLCHGLTDKQIRGAARTAGCSQASLYRSLGVRPQCGKCVQMVDEIRRGNGESPAQNELAGAPLCP